jgi:hypothetical protein
MISYFKYGDIFLYKNIVFYYITAVDTSHINHELEQAREPVHDRQRRRNIIQLGLFKNNYFSSCRIKK